MTRNLSKYFVVLALMLSSCSASATPPDDRLDFLTAEYEVCVTEIGRNRGSAPVRYSDELYKTALAGCVEEATLPSDNTSSPEQMAALTELYVATLRFLNDVPSAPKPAGDTEFFVVESNGSAEGQPRANRQETLDEVDPILREDLVLLYAPVVSCWAAGLQSAHDASTSADKAAWPLMEQQRTRCAVAEEVAESEAERLLAGKPAYGDRGNRSSVLEKFTRLLMGLNVVSWLQENGVSLGESLRIGLEREGQ